MLLNDLEINVFKLNNTEFELIGTLERFSSLIWPVNFKSTGAFELWAPITEQNNELLKAGNVLWIGGTEACIIEIINPQLNNKGEKKYNVKGRTLECLLDTRILLGSYAKKGTMSTIMYDLVNSNCVNPSNTKRKIPWLECAPDLRLGESISYQRTGFTINSNLEKVSENNINIGYVIRFEPRDKKLVFQVFESTDRSINNELGNDPVEISTEFDDILDSDYYLSVQEYRNTAFIQGEIPKDAEGKETGEPRRETYTGDTNSVGYERLELYVDARDLQSNINEEGTQRTIPLDEYMESLVSGGKSKLAEHPKVEEFKATIRTDGSTQYIFGVDYFLGDIITVTDEELGVRADVQVLGLTRNFSSRYELELDLGFRRPTIIDKIKRIST